MPTIKEIARIANVSPSTVSNVINGRTHKMKPETLAHVEKILKEQNYVSNMAGRLLARNGSRLIAVILTYTHSDEQNIVQDPFFSELIGALENAIRKEGYFMLLYTSASVEESLKMVASWNIEGIILQGCAPWDCEKYMQNKEIPFVFIDAYNESNNKDMLNVGLDDYKGGKLVAQYMMECGHKKVAFLTYQDEPFGVDKQRLLGFNDELVSAGVNFDLKRDTYSFSFRRAEREKFFKSFAENEMKNYTALFFCSDFYAVDAMNVFKDNGIKIPGDISIVGFDDNIFAKTARPTLTTVRQNVTDKANHSTHMLMKLIHGEQVTEKDIKLDVTLKVRDSLKSI